MLPARQAIEAQLNTLGEALVWALRKTTSGRVQKIQELVEKGMSILTRKATSIEEVGQISKDFAGCVADLTGRESAARCWLRSLLAALLAGCARCWLTLLHCAQFGE